MWRRKCGATSVLKIPKFFIFIKIIRKFAEIIITMKLRHLIYIGILAIAQAVNAAGPEPNVAEEVVWIIGDEPIWRSEVEETYQQMLQEKFPIKGDPYCFVPEQIAMERLYLHQADMDTVEVSPKTIASEVDGRINEWISRIGSRERLEEYMHKSLPEIRAFLTQNLTNNYRVQQVQQKLTSKVKVTPAQVRRYFDKLPVDSIPYIPTQVEVQIVTLNPLIPRETIEDVKDKLRGFADRVNSGSASFSTLAIMYSEDGSAPNGGEIGWMPRAQLDKAYADVAFSLNDPSKASKVVESEFGYHIIQLIEKRGDRINTRHILMRPRAAAKDIDDSRMRLDSIRADILDEKFSFDDAASVLSQDKDTRNNHGLMTNSDPRSQNYGTSLFQMSELPAEMAREVARLQPGGVSKAFSMVDEKTGRDVVCIVKLKDRIEAHRADLSNDFQLIKSMAENARREQILADWVNKKISETYIRIEPGYADCPDWRYNWLKKKK